MNGLISINGTVFPADQAVLSPLDRGFLLGDAVFDVLVGFSSKILNITRHLERICDHAEQCSIPVPWSNEALKFEIQTLVEQCQFPKSYIRIVFTRGLGLGLTPAVDSVTQKMIYCLPAKVEPQDYYLNGISLRRRSLDFTHRGPHLKIPNYLPSITAMTRAHKEGYQDILWTNADQEITEASAANIFLIGREGDLVEIATPGEYSGLLPGLTRNTLIHLLNQAKIPVTERIINIDELARFDEGFLCSTVRGLVPIQKIDQQRLYSTRPNAIFHHIQRLHQAWVTSELGFSVDWNSGALKA